MLRSTGARPMPFFCPWTHHRDLPALSGAGLRSQRFAALFGPTFSCHSTGRPFQVASCLPAYFLRTWTTKLVAVAPTYPDFPSVNLRCWANAPCSLM